MSLDCVHNQNWERQSQSGITRKDIAIIIAYYVKILTLPGKVENSSNRIAFLLEREMRIEIGSHAKC